MLGASSFAALLPPFTALWSLSAAEAGWISGIFYVGYTLAVPVLVTSTDSKDPRSIYLACAALTAASAFLFAWFADGFWSAMAFRLLAGVGLAGTYMPGLRILTDQISGPSQSRAVAFYTSSFGLGTALSFLFTERSTALLSWQWSFAIAGVAAAVACAIALLKVPARRPAAAAARRNLRADLALVLRDRTALRFSIAYAVHNWELFGYRSWLVAYLAFAAAATGRDASLPPTAVAAVATLLGMVASIIGNEIAARTNRPRTVVAFMLLSAVTCLGFGMASGLPPALLAAIALLHATLIAADSAAMTAGLVACAPAERRGMTMAMYSCVGFLGAFLGPTVFGTALGLAGPAVAGGWIAAFASISIVLVVGAAAFVALGPRSETARRSDGA